MSSERENEEYKDDEIIGSDDKIIDDDNYYGQEELVRMSSNINSMYITRTVEDLLKELNQGLYIIPAFQRRYVWKKKKVAELAFSLIKNIPIPALYVYIKGEKRYVLDGQQRLISLFLYFNDLEYSSSDNEIDFGTVSKISNELRLLENIERQKLTVDEKRKMKELKTKLNKFHMRRCDYSIVASEGEAKITFGSFDPRIQKFLWSQQLHITLLECKDKEPNKTYAYLFKTLNTSGKKLGSQEIRNGVYWETYLYKKLLEINKNETWRKIYGNISIYSKDIEILLKALALRHYSYLVKDKNGDDAVKIAHPNFSWSRIIEEYSRYSVSHDVAEEIEELEKFLDCIHLDGQLSQKASLKKAAFEAAFVACSLSKMKWDLCKLETEWFEKLYTRFEKIESNKTSVEKRLTVAYLIARDNNGTI